MVARVTAYGVGIGLRQALEVRAREVVEQQVERLGEEGADLLLEMGLDGVLVRQQVVQGAIEPILVDRALADTGDVVQGRARVEAFRERELA
jgi:hypothetical protein